jgi:hypothetical protein
MRDKTTGKWVKGQSGNPASRFQPGNAHAWKRGSSGNPAGVPKQYQQFRETFASALLAGGDLQELSRVLWECAKKGESWALLEITKHLAPGVSDRDGPPKAAPFGPGQAAAEDIDLKLDRLFREYELAAGQRWARDTDLHLDKLTTDEQAQFLGLVAKLKAQPGEVLRWKPAGQAL